MIPHDNLFLAVAHCVPFSLLKLFELKILYLTKQYSHHGELNMASVMLSVRSVTLAHRDSSISTRSGIHCHVPKLNQLTYATKEKQMDKKKKFILQYMEYACLGIQ